jgi:GTP pyrophosphokinase
MPSSGQFPPAACERILAQISTPAGRDRFLAGCSLARTLYGDSTTLSGLPCLEHGLRVVEGLLEFSVDVDTLLGGLFNQLGEQEALDTVGEQCGREVMHLLRALRRLDIYTEKAQHKNNQRTLEAIRRAALTVIGGDVRVVLIRLMVALVTLRSAENLPADRRRLLARDVRNIYGPLANRLGIWQLKWELEDTAFRYLEPELYTAIEQQLNQGRAERTRRIEAARAILQQKLQEEGIRAEVTGRPKHIYSIHRKMIRKQVTLEKIFDVQALRIIIMEDDPENGALTEEQRKRAKYLQCYRALGLVHNLWQPEPDEFDDYIQKPKPNGYRSLHTTVRDDHGEVLEIQIRTLQMHREAEQGLAAHWVYKEGGRPTQAMVRQVESLRYLLNVMNEPAAGTATPAPAADSADDPALIDEAILDRVYVFSPKGDVYDLPQGSTPIDFAYKIHSEVGHRCRGGRVNGKMVPLTAVLQSGDRVEILTTSRDKPGKPSRDWMNENAGYTRTNHARARVRKWFRENEREQNIEYGRQAVEREIRQLKAAGITAEDLAIHRGEPLEDFLARVGFGDITIPQVQGLLAVILRERKPAELPPEEEPERSTTPSAERTHRGLTVLGVSGLATHTASCCNPIPPEPITGYITRGRGVSVHRADCPEIIALEKAEPGRIVEVDWGEESADTFSVPFRIKAYRASGILENIAKMLQGQNIPLRKSKMLSARGHTAFYIEAEVNGLEQANWLQHKLENLDHVFEVRSR